MDIKEEYLDIEGIKKSKRSLIDQFIRRTAVLTQTPERITDMIIKDQWKQANLVTQPGVQVSSIDFASIGKFMISKAKANRRLRRHEKSLERLVSLVQDEKTLLKTFRNHDCIKNIKTKLKQNES
jgi:hypothetical protein